MNKHNLEPISPLGAKRKTNVIDMAVVRKLAVDIKAPRIKSALELIAEAHESEGLGIYAGGMWVTAEQLPGYLVGISVEDFDVLIDEALSIIKQKKGK